MGQIVLLQAAIALLKPTISYRALEIGLSPVWLGVISASFALLPLVSAVPMGRMMDRRGEKATLMYGCACIALGAAGLWVLGTSAGALVLASTVLGLGHLLTLLGQQSLIARSVNERSSDSAFGHLSVVISLGQAAGAGLITLLGGNTAAPATGPMFLAGVVLAAGALGSTLALKSPVARMKRSSETSRDLVRATLRVPGFRSICLASVAVLTTIDLLSIYLPALALDRGVGSHLVGLLLMVRALASIAPRLVLSLLVQRFGRISVLSISIAISAAGAAVLAVPTSAAVLFAAMIVMGAGLGVGQPITTAWVAQSMPARLRSSGLSLRLVAHKLGQLTVPAGAGAILAAGGVGAVFGATSAFLALSYAVCRGLPD